MKILMFSSKDCGTCRLMKQALTAIAARYGFEFVVHQIEDDPTPFTEYGIGGTPAAVVLDGKGEEVGRFIGHQTETSIENTLKKFGCIE